MTELTFRGKLVAHKTDHMGYTNYVFENFEYKDIDHKYIMCVQFPNWDQAYIDINDEGFVTVRYVRAGIDRWFNGKDYIPYLYTDVHFMKFVPLDNPKDVVLDLD